MKSSKHGRYFSQPQLQSMSEYIQISPTTAKFDKFYQPPPLPTLTQFQQKYFSQLYERKLKNEKRLHNQAKFNQSSLIFENSKQSSPSRVSKNAIFLKNQKQKTHTYHDIYQSALQNGKSFTEFMEDKYHKLSSKQLEVIPPTFLKTFHIHKEEKLTVDTIIEPRLSASPVLSNSSHAMSSPFFDNTHDSIISKVVNELNPLESSGSNSLSNSQMMSKFIMCPSPLDKMSTPSSGKRPKIKTQASFGYSNSPYERFELRRSIMKSSDHRKKIVLNELQDDLMKKQQLQKLGLHLIAQSPDLKKSQTMKIDMKFPPLEKNILTSTLGKTHSQSIHQSQGSSKQRINKSNEPIQIISDEKERKPEGISKNTNKFIQICQYCCNLEANSSQNSSQVCQCKGKVKPFSNKSVIETNLLEVGAGDRLKQNEEQGNTEPLQSLEKMINQTENKQVNSVRSIDSSQLNINHHNTRTSIIVGQDLQYQNPSVIYEKQQMMKQQFERQFQKNNPIINQTYSSLKIQNATKKRELIKTIMDGSPFHKKSVVMSSQLIPSGTLIQTNSRRVEANARLSLIDESAFKIKTEEEQMLETLKNNQNNLDKKKLSQIYQPGSLLPSSSAKGNGGGFDFKSPDSLKSNTLKRILEAQRQIDEYESKKLLQDGSEIESLLKKKQLNNGEGSSPTAGYANNEGSSRRKKDSLQKPSKPRDFILDAVESPRNGSPNQFGVQNRLSINFNDSSQGRTRSPSQFFQSSPPKQTEPQQNFSQIKRQSKQISECSSPQVISGEKGKPNNQPNRQSVYHGYRLEGKFQSQQRTSIMGEGSKESSNASKDSKTSNGSSSIIPSQGNNFTQLYIPSRIKGIGSIFKRQSGLYQQMPLHNNNPATIDFSKLQNQSLNLHTHSQDISFSNYFENNQTLPNAALNAIEEHKIIDIKRNKSETPSRGTETNINLKIPKLDLKTGSAIKIQSAHTSNNELRSNDSLNSPVYEELIKKRQERANQQLQQKQNSELQLRKAKDNEQKEKLEQEMKTKLSKLRLKHQGSILQHESKCTSPIKQPQSPSNYQADNSSKKFSFNEEAFSQEKEYGQSAFASNRNTPEDSPACSSSRQSYVSNHQMKKESQSEMSEVDQDKYVPVSKNKNDSENIHSNELIKSPPQDKSKLKNYPPPRLSQNIESLSLKLNVHALNQSKQNEFNEVTRSRKESESRQNPPPPPTYRLSINLSNAQSPVTQKSQHSTTNQNRKRPSNFEEDFQKKLLAKQKEMKSLKCLLNDAEKLIDQLIQKIYYFYEEDEEDESKNQQEPQNKFFVKINQKYKSEDVQKTDLIKDLTKQLRKTIKNDFISIPILKELLVHFLEFSFSDIPSKKDELFLRFKMRKRTLETIISVLLFIFEEDEYPIEVIAAAESNLKKNYRLICFLPSLHDELGGSNYMNKITLRFSNTLLNRLIDMYKNIERDESEANSPLEQEKVFASRRDIVPSAFKIQIGSERLTQNEPNYQESPGMKSQYHKYSVIESNIESHFEQVFLRSSQKRGSSQFIESQQHLKLASERLIDSASQIKFVGKYQLEQIERLHTQVLNLMRFIYHNNSYSQLDMSNMLDKSNIKAISKLFDLNSNCFFEIKEILWTTLSNFHVFPTTLLRIQEQLERYRYVLTQVPLVEQLLSDPTLTDCIIRDMEWRLTSDETQVKSVFENQFTLKVFCDTLISEFIFRMKSTYNIEIFFKELNLSYSQFEFISDQFIKSSTQIGFDYSFCLDLKMKFQKLKYRLNLEVPPLRLLGGYKALNDIIMVSHAMISNPSYENEYTEYIKKFPEDLHNLLYELPQNYIKENSRYNNKPGLKFFEYFILSLLSAEDCYSISDFRAGLQTYNIAKTTPIHWKSLFEQSMRHLKYSEDIIKTVMQQVSNQFLIFYQEQPDVSFAKPLLK